MGTNEAQRHADSLARRLDAMWAAYDAGLMWDEYGDAAVTDSHCECVDVLDAMAELALSVELELGSPFHVWFSLGGPNVLIVDDGRGGGGNARIEAYWGTDSATVRDAWDGEDGAPIQRTADYFRGMVQD